jgi:hypothetical protein
MKAASPTGRSTGGRTSRFPSETVRSAEGRNNSNSKINGNNNRNGKNNDNRKSKNHKRLYPWRSIT